MSKSRTALFTVFLVIPTGLLRALANKSVTIDATNSDDEGEEQKQGPKPGDVQDATSGARGSSPGRPWGGRACVCVYVWRGGWGIVPGAGLEKG